MCDFHLPPASADSEDRPGGPDADAESRAILERIGAPFLVDIHTHFMPDNVLGKVWGYFDAMTGLGVPWPIEYRASEERRLADLRAQGVGVFTSLSYPHRPGMAEWLNGWSRDFAARTPDCVHSGTFYPEADAGRYVAEALRDGVAIWKSHVQVGAYDPTDPLLDPVWGMITDAGTPVVIHCGSGPEPGEYTGPGPIVDVLRRFPRLRLVIAHMGMPEYSDFLDLAEAYEGVYLDTTMVFTDFIEKLMPFPPTEHGRLRDLGDRIVLGSDFPNIPYTYAHQLRSLERLGLGDEWMRAVCHDNGVELLAGTPAVLAAQASRTTPSG